MSSENVSNPNRPTGNFAQFKIVLLGESAVGKSSIVHRFVKNLFDDMRESTIGAAFLTQSIALPENEATVKFEIWDTAGQERYKSLAPMYYRNANSALCVFDITSRASFSKAQYWIKELKKQAPEEIVICLVGNKLDLSDDREVQESEVTEYIQLIDEEGSKILFSECSAKLGDGILDIFYKVARALPVDETIEGANNRNRITGRMSTGVDLSKRAKSQQSSSCC